MLNDTGGCVSFALVTFMELSLLSSAHSLAIYSIALLIKSYKHGQRNNSMFSKRSGEHIVGVSPLTLYDGAFW